MVLWSATFAASVACAPSNWCATAETREPADTETKEIAKYCYEHGLIMITAGTFNNVIRILVPLVVTDEQFNEGLDVLEAALAGVAERKQAALSHA